MFLQLKLNFSLPDRYNKTELKKEFTSAEFKRVGQFCGRAEQERSGLFFVNNYDKVLINHLRISGRVHDDSINGMSHI